MPSYLWQNFLTDEWAKQQIIQTVAQMQSDYNIDNVIEIWPGQWALTQWLINLFDHLVLIEMDTKMKPYLEKLKVKQQWNNSESTKVEVAEKEDNSNNNDKSWSINFNLSIVWWDILHQWPLLAPRPNKSHTLVYGSLPYYITSPIFRLVMIECGHHHGLFIIQKEVGDKIASSSNKKSYLRWLLNNEFEVTTTQIIPPNSFTPAPKVYSCVVKLTRRSEPMLSPIEYEQMLVLLDQINGFKRKTLGKIWKMIWRNNLPTDLAPKRLEELWWEEMRLLIYTLRTS